MKWFRHMTDASQDPFMRVIRCEFGLEGIARWWILLETVAANMDKTDRCGIALPWSEWQRILVGKRKKLDTYLLRIEFLRKIDLEENGNILEIRIPNLLKIRDEYTRKSGHTPVATPDVVAPYTDTDTYSRRGAAAPKGDEPNAPNLWDVWVGIDGDTKASRSFLGLQIRSYGEEKVAQAVAEVMTKRPAEPRQYLVGILKPKVRRVVV